MRLACILIPSFLATAAAFAQTSSAPVEFEVASIKPAEPLVERVNIGVHIDGAQVHIADYSLADYIRLAYRLKSYQVTGPEWLSLRFNVDAKLPAGATRQQVPEMLQTLLTTRFELKTHRDTKEFPVYALVAASGGAKLKEEPPDPSDPIAGGNAPVDMTVAGGRGGTSVNLPGGASFSLANNRLEGAKITMPVFADVLSRFVDRPIVDRTNLTGRYDFTLELTPEDYRAMQIRAAISAGVVLPPEALRFLDGATEDSLHNALRSFGLRLEPSKAPLEVLVIDHILKAPAAN